MLYGFWGEFIQPPVPFICPLTLSFSVYCVNLLGIVVYISRIPLPWNGIFIYENSSLGVMNNIDKIITIKTFAVEHIMWILR